jgi:hypothetical protein
MANKRFMAMEQIEASFEKMSNEPNMNSLKAILRIGAEQVEQRGKLGFWRNIAFVTGPLALIMVFVVPFVDARTKASLAIYEYIAVAICVLSVGVLFRVRGKLDQYLSEEQRIKKLMVLASQKIVGTPNFNVTPLTNELKGALKDACRHEKASEELRAIIDVH